MRAWAAAAAGALSLLGIALWFDERQFLKQPWESAYLEADRALGVGLLFDPARHVHAQSSPPQRIDVYEHKFFGNILTIDGDLQLTERDHHVYHEMLVHTPLALAPGAESVLVIGGGDGGTVCELLKHRSIHRIRVVDIDERVSQVARAYFPSIGRCLDDARVTLEHADAAVWTEEQTALGDAERPSFDVVIVDSSDFGAADSLATPAFLAALRALLRPGGVLATNLTSAAWNVEGMLDAVARQREVFRHVLPFQAFIPTYLSGHYAFALCSDDHDLAAALCAAGTHGSALQTRYYSEAIHRAAFALPRELASTLGVGQGGMATGHEPRRGGDAAADASLPPRADAEGGAGLGEGGDGLSGEGEGTGVDAAAAAWRREDAEEGEMPGEEGAVGAEPTEERFVRASGEVEAEDEWRFGAAAEEELRTFEKEWRLEPAGEESAEEEKEEEEEKAVQVEEQEVEEQEVEELQQDELHEETVGGSEWRDSARGEEGHVERAEERHVAADEPIEKEQEEVHGGEGLESLEWHAEEQERESEGREEEGRGNAWRVENSSEGVDARPEPIDQQRDDAEYHDEEAPLPEGHKMAGEEEEKEAHESIGEQEESAPAVEPADEPTEDARGAWEHGSGASDRAGEHFEAEERGAASDAGHGGVEEGMEHGSDWVGGQRVREWEHVEPVDGSHLLGEGEQGRYNPIMERLREQLDSIDEERFSAGEEQVDSIGEGHDVYEDAEFEPASEHRAAEARLSNEDEVANGEEERLWSQHEGDTYEKEGDGLDRHEGDSEGDTYAEEGEVLDVVRDDYGAEVHFEPIEEQPRGVEDKRAQAGAEAARSEWEQDPFEAEGEDESGHGGTKHVADIMFGGEPAASHEPKTVESSSSSSSSEGEEAVAVADESGGQRLERHEGVPSDEGDGEEAEVDGGAAAWPGVQGDSKEDEEVDVGEAELRDEEGDSSTEVEGVDGGAGAWPGDGEEEDWEDKQHPLAGDGGASSRRLLSVPSTPSVPAYGGVENPTELQLPWRLTRRLGAHVVAEAVTSPFEPVLDDVDALREMALDAATSSGLVPVHHTFHRFDPHGVTGLVLLAESHLSVHTWPQFGYAAIDAYACNETGSLAHGVNGEGGNPWMAARKLAEAIGAEGTRVAWLERGIPDTPGPQ